ncbi:hypothetical protein GCM10012275_13010 [Longimycelium tulufanense]|uniref:Uncharacterized protein n=1 Tax=Longimycelium tulufanense TaxID=907463 RepID=A0A8J3FUG7_9PSEU|nr:hypothetical protein [Longimycelium tulufanense]GGM43447.1 hypothetical protein GCM10012275_13010 [Longimycelium tulufanense]
MINLVVFGVLLTLTGATFLYLEYHYRAATPTGEHAPRDGSVTVQRLIDRLNNDLVAVTAAREFPGRPTASLMWTQKSPNQRLESPSAGWPW